MKSSFSQILMGLWMPIVIAATPTQSEIISFYKSSIENHTVGSPGGVQAVFTQQQAYQLFYYIDNNESEIFNRFKSECTEYRNGVSLFDISKKRAEDYYKEYLQTGDDIHKLKSLLRSQLLVEFCKK